jgi:hypothetical protein
MVEIDGDGAAIAPQQIQIRVPLVHDVHIAMVARGTDGWIAGFRFRRKPRDARPALVPASIMPP